MRRTPSLALLLVLTSLMQWCLTSCKNDDPATTQPITDTRIWVRDALAKINVMDLEPTFNKERADIIKGRFDQEQDGSKRINLAVEYAFELLKSGQTKESLQVLGDITRYSQAHNIQPRPDTKRNLYSLIGVAFLRHGEVENCLQDHNYESCFMPIRGAGVHNLPFGSENAIKQYELCLNEFPDDLETKYLLNLAYMTLGKYPGGVPKKFLIPPSWFESSIAFPRYKDIAAEVGLNRRGLAGGVVIDDFTNDGWLDIVITSWGPHQELIFYKNNGDGTFSDQTQAMGLKGQVAVLHINQTDFNNDGWLDLYLMRGAWYQRQGDIPNTLLMNTGKGTFEDVTLKAGLTKVAPTQASAWADFNLDGWLDLVVANESLTNFDRGIDLYINNQDGTFRHASAEYGLTLNQFFKGCVAVDANNDRYPDIYFSALADPNSLLINETGSGQNRFRIAGPESNVSSPRQSFPCWSFDFDNDGLEDIFVSSYTNDGTPSTFWMKSQTHEVEPDMLPKLYRNKGNLQFEEVGVSMGLTESAFTMGCNFGDINTDGFLDFYLATGNPLYQSLVPNKMYLNIDGKKFEDISFAGGFAHIQKGHGVSFGDLDRDGDEDLYVVIGGAFDGDDYFNCLFENPNPDKNNWVVLKLEGTTANRPAIGARVALTVIENGKEREIHRTVTSGASFGANSLALEVGLRKATSIVSVKVQWPCIQCPDQIFAGMNINSAYHLKQHEATPKQLEYTAAPFVKRGSQPVQ